MFPIFGVNKETERGVHLHIQIGRVSHDKSEFQPGHAEIDRQTCLN